MRDLELPAPAAAFRAVVDEEVARFPNTRLVRRVNDGSVTLAHYHAILTTLFHQTYSGPYTFARAAVNCSWRHEAAKEYLLQHAEEERTHWRWVLNDLNATAYTGLNPRGNPPHPTCQAFVGLLYYIAEEMPVARLAIAAVLEGIGAAHGGTYGSKLIQLLSLKKSQVSFFLSHGTTDKVHIVDLWKVIGACDLTADEWNWMAHAARVGGQLYWAMYDHEAFA